MWVSSLVSFWCMRRQRGGARTFDHSFLSGADQHAGGWIMIIPPLA
jgi:hypothetical protein